MAQQEQRLEQLKQKYQPVLNFIQQQGQVRLQNVNMQGDKLFIRGEASSEDAKNKVWDQIKLVDPSYSDLTADRRQPFENQQTILRKRKRVYADLRGESRPTE